MVVCEEYQNDGGCRGYQIINNMHGKLGVLGFIWKIELQGFSSMDFSLNEMVQL
jgi:hypothetical protein